MFFLEETQNEYYGMLLDAFFFLISKERGQTSRGLVDFPTRLAPRETSILCRQTRNFIKKRGKNIYKRRGD